MPIIKKQALCVDEHEVKLIAYSDIRSNESQKNKKCGVHFFIDDYRFERVYQHPEHQMNRLSQYAFILSPDFSTYADMNQWRKIESIAHSRWVGAYAQEQGLIVYPTVSWSEPSSFEYCFDGIEQGSVVAVGMIGCKHNKTDFMRGYNEMLNRIEPEAVICYGNPYAEMEGHLITVRYSNRTRREDV